MGGSGTWYRWDKRDTTESCKQIDIRYMRKHGLLFPGHRGTLSWTLGGNPSGSVGYRVESDVLILNYRYRHGGEDWQDITETVSLDSTPCHYGGSRPWFRCPRCNRRIAVLYVGGKWFLCRHCYDLVYESQQESLPFRLLSKAQKIRDKLGGSACMDDLPPPKPKGMHWRTYERLVNESEEAYQLSMIYAVQWFVDRPKKSPASIKKEH